MSSQYAVNNSVTTTGLKINKDFCCGSNDNRKLLKFVNSKLGIFKGANTIFTSEELSLFKWYLEVSEYAYNTITLEPIAEGTITIPTSKAIFLKAAWPTDCPENLKLIELGLPEQPGLIGMTIPFPIGYTSPEEWNYTVFHETHFITTQNPFKGTMKFRNLSQYATSISILTTK